MNNPGKPVYASPSVRRFARELGVDATLVKGTGNKNRVTPDDIKLFVKTALTSTNNTSQHRASPLLDLLDWPNVDYARFGPVERIPLSRITRLSGPALARNAMLIPHVTTFDKTDVSELEIFRKTLNAEADPADAKITLLTFAVKAVVSALIKFPAFNSSLDGKDLVQKQYWNIGVAVDTPDGLVVPVIAGADSKGIRDLANEMATLAASAREGKLKPAQMQGATFTISSLGGIGATNFTPIINAPEVAILGMARADIQPVWDGTAFVPGLIQPLSLSFDHRAVDGVASAHFLGHVGRILNEFRRLLV